MKSLIKIAFFASVLSGCAAMEDITDRRSAPVVASIPGGPDAVTRNPPPAAPQAEGPRLPSASAEPAEPVTLPGGGATSGPIDPSIDPATARSYNATWEDRGFRHRSVMFPHIIDGCKVMIQSRRTLDYVSGAEGEFFEREGPDCNCDLVIDGFEDVFAQLNDEYKTPRMFDVCIGPGVDGATRQLEIMRESLKEDRNFGKMKNVEGF